MCMSVSLELEASYKFMVELFLRIHWRGSVRCSWVGLLLFHALFVGEIFVPLCSDFCFFFCKLQGREILTQKLPLWQQACSDPNKIPDRAIQLMQQMALGSNGTVMPSPLSTSKSNLVISDPIPGAKPLPVPPELAPFVGVSIVCRGMSYVLFLKS